jgi:hypothetical protein
VAKVNHCHAQGISGVNGRIGYAVVLSNGQTFGQFAVPQLQYAQEWQEMPCPACAPTSDSRGPGLSTDPGAITHT